MSTSPAINLVVNTVLASNAWIRASRRVFRPLGLSEAQFNVLHALQGAEHHLTQRELSDILFVDRSNVTGLIDRMEATGWVRRDRVPGDRRAYQITLTDEGLRLWRQANTAYLHAAERAAANLTPAQIRELTAALPVMERSARTLELELTV